MKYRVLLIESEEGYSVQCPALPGCFSQGRTSEEALHKIQEAIRLWVDVADEEDAEKATVQDSGCDGVTCGANQINGLKA